VDSDGDYELKVHELDTSVFIIPGTFAFVALTSFSTSRPIRTTH
jgi:hypothetical protein